MKQIRNYLSFTTLEILDPCMYNLILQKTLIFEKCFVLCIFALFVCVRFDLCPFLIPLGFVMFSVAHLFSFLCCVVYVCLSSYCVLCMFVCFRTVCCVCLFVFVLCFVYVCLSSYCVLCMFVCLRTV